MRPRPLRFPNMLCLIAAAALSPFTAPGQSQDAKATESGGTQDGDVWCGVFLARTGPASGKKEASGLISQLAAAFPEMGNFELVGESTCAVYKEYESWLVPSKQLFLKLDSLGPQPGENGVHLHVQLWQQKHVILKTDAILRQRPIFIAGPKWGDGRLVMVLRLAGHAGGAPR